MSTDDISENWSLIVNLFLQIVDKLTPLYKDLKGDNAPFMIKDLRKEVTNRAGF